MKRDLSTLITGCYFIVAALIGLAAMTLTMGLPDRLSLYMPIFHLWSLWLLGTGIVFLRSQKTSPT